MSEKKLKFNDKTYIDYLKEELKKGHITLKEYMEYKQEYNYRFKDYIWMKKGITMSERTHLSPSSNLLF